MSPIAPGGHFWTLAPTIGARVRPPAAPPSTPWSLQIGGASGEPLELSGELTERPGASTFLVILHGLGGSAWSLSSVRAANAAAARGWSSLRVSLRGADGRGQDLYHAGLVEDISLILSSPTVSSHGRVLLYGASVGGHMALRHALDPHPRLGAVAAVCPPLDLAATADALDRGRAALYRRAILRSLKRSYRALAARRTMPHSVEEVEGANRFRDYDRLVVVPRFGFGTVENYYATMSVGPHLGELRIPSLYLGAIDDPMVPFSSLRPWLESAGPPLEARARRRGGHLGFPTPVEARVLEWLDRAA